MDRFIILTDILSKSLNSVNEFLWTYVLVVPLIVLGVFFTYKTRFVQLRYFKEMFKLLGENESDKNDASSVSSFQAFCISTASRVGTGNLAGIAIALSVGGPGAIFWMWISAIIGAASSFVESVLAQIYKESDGNNGYIGGPAYYMEKGLKKKWMGVCFSILTILCFGLVFMSVQSNTITLSLTQAFDIDPIYIAIVLTILSSLVIFGGISSVAKISEIVVPFMAGAYILASLFIIIKNASLIPEMISSIISNAFGFKQIVGGGIGGTILVGVKRGLFSNEAGMGSVPNVAATAKTSHPAKQGLIQALGVFTDTLLICSCTAFAILLSGTDLSGELTGIQLTQHAYISQIGSMGGIFISVCIFLFAFSSIISNYCYGESNIKFLSKKKSLLIFYKVCASIMVFLGCLVSMEIVWTVADIFMALMAITNLIAIAFLGKFAFRALDDYTSQKKSGVNNPTFKASNISELENVSEW